jgi:hypothetical protein
MARDWLQIAEAIEAAYPRSLGGATGDENLRLQLVDWANDGMNEIQKIRRWTLAFGTATTVTTPGTSTYAIPNGIAPLDNLYYVDASGYPQVIENYTRIQASLRIGEGASVPNGIPRYFAYVASGGLVVNQSINATMSIQLFPAPDNAGPSSGNYTLVFEGYQLLTAIPIVETTGSITSGASTLTVPSTSYLVGKGVPSNNGFVSVRGAGFAQSATINDDFVTNVGAAIVVPGTSVTLSTLAGATVTTAQTFFNTVNWLIREYPKVLEFAVMREVATRLGSKDDYQKWEARYQHELELLEDAEIDRAKLQETWLTWTPGQRVPQLRRLDTLLGWDIRGASI